MSSSALMLVERDDLPRVVICYQCSELTRGTITDLSLRAHYMDGELVPPKPGAGADPKPAAANDGTVISVSHLANPDSALRAC